LAALYRANCSGCHGLNGEGGQIGISLRASGFLAIVSDDMLAETILRGRANTAMPAWRQFDNRDVSDLLAFIRSWQPLRSNREEVLARRAGEGSIATGWKFYRSRCTVCHGENGEGKIGPSINNQAVLSVVSNEFLHDTIVRGRPGTAMPAWRQLSSEDVADVIALLRSWQTQPAKELPDVRVQGDPQNGELLYSGVCASCHGPHAEGALGPQLSNAVFLDTVNDATLTQWISFGRPGTQMRPHLRGHKECGPFKVADRRHRDVLRSLRGRQAIDGERIGLGYARARRAVPPDVRELSRHAGRRNRRPRHS
jgi:mono/diheme cytochrome c family protein